MSSLALYRRYRPHRFEDVLGQDHVTENLQASIREGRIGHAYLFSGSRGTGKTTTARILAKALNCEEGPTPEPCNRCSTCLAINEGNSLDVIEIDAASHGGVDDVRELRENAVLAPAVARRKVYIVDEAHMVSTAGWNAFLKTVEEPPDHVVFVFATTEPHKVLPTILSRCQRFDFRRVSSSVIADHLARVAKEEGIEADEGALQLVARAAEGGVRDALSTLDQLAATGSVTMADAARLLGGAAGDALFDFADALASNDTTAALQTIARLVEAGQDLRVFARQMLEHLRALLITKQVDEPGDLIDATEETRARYGTQADAFGAGKLTHLVRLFVDALTDMRDQTAPRLAMELAVVRATMPEVDDTATSAIARIERLERVLEIGGAATGGVATGGAPAATEAEPAPARATTPEPAAPAKPAPAQPAATPEPATPEPAKAAPKSKRAKAADPEPEPAPAARAASGLIDLEKIRRSWSMVLEEVRKKSRSLHALLADASVAGYEDDTLALEARYDFHAKQLSETKNARMIAESVAEVLGASPRVRATVRATQAEPEPSDDLADTMPGDPLEVVRASFGDDVEEG